MLLILHFLCNYRILILYFYNFTFKTSIIFIKDFVICTEIFVLVSFPLSAILSNNGNNNF